MYLHLDSELTPFPQVLTTALFSFLYHLASYENGRSYINIILIFVYLRRSTDWVVTPQPFTIHV